MVLSLLARHLTKLNAVMIASLRFITGASSTLMSVNLGSVTMTTLSSTNTCTKNVTKICEHFLYLSSHTESRTQLVKL